MSTWNKSLLAEIERMDACYLERMMARLSHWVLSRLRKNRRQEWLLGFLINWTDGSVALDSLIGHINDCLSWQSFQGRKGEELVQQHIGIEGVIQVTHVEAGEDKRILNSYIWMSNVNSNTKISIWEMENLNSCMNKLLTTYVQQTDFYKVVWDLG